LARYKKDSRGYFYTTIELPPGVGGKRQRKYIRAKTVALLKEKIEQFHADQAAGGAPIRRSGDHTVGSWLPEWLEGERMRGSIRPSTYLRYDADIRNHITPAIGKIPLKTLTLPPIQQMVDHALQHGRKRKDGKPRSLAPRTVRHMVTPLIEALDAAKRLGYVKHNVARDVELPAVKEPDLYQLEPDEIRTFLQEVRGDRFEALYWFGFLGFREGELLGLRKSDIDMDARTITITVAIQRVKPREGKSKLIHIDPKTERAKRSVQFPDDWHRVLLEHFTRLAEWATVKGWQEHDLVFPSTKGTAMEAQNFINRHFKPALRRAKLPAEKIRFHDLRHAAASMLIALGYDARTVADILGHSSPEFTLRQYATSFASQRHRATADIGELLKPDGDRILELPRRTIKKSQKSQGVSVRVLLSELQL
jgi:integrase